VGNHVLLEWAAITGAAISEYRVFKDGLRDVPAGSRTLVVTAAAPATNATDQGGVSELPAPVAYYQVVGVSCAGDLEGPY